MLYNRLCEGKASLLPLSPVEHQINWHTTPISDDDYIWSSPVEPTNTRSTSPPSILKQQTPPLLQAVLHTSKMYFNSLTTCVLQNVFKNIQYNIFLSWFWRRLQVLRPCSDTRLSRVIRTWRTLCREVPRMIFRGDLGHILLAVWRQMLSRNINSFAGRVFVSQRLISERGSEIRVNPRRSERGPEEDFKQPSSDLRPSSTSVDNGSANVQLMTTIVPTAFFFFRKIKRSKKREKEKKPTWTFSPHLRFGLSPHCSSIMQHFG